MDGMAIRAPYWDAVWDGRVHMLTGSGRRGTSTMADCTTLPHRQ